MLREMVSRAVADAAARINDHDRIALMFSGGRDSLAAFFLLADFLDKVTVYHCDTGDAYPETQEVVAKVRALSPNFVTVEGQVQEVWRQLGYPADLLPTECTPIGRLKDPSWPMLVDRYSCCFYTYMKPMFDRVVSDGMSLVIRGQRRDDYGTPPLQSGDTDTFEVLYPIEDWTAADVDAYLEYVGVEPAPFYARGLSSTLDCMHCSAWSELGGLTYLERFHPDAHAETLRRVTIVRSAVRRSLEKFDFGEQK